MHKIASLHGDGDGSFAKKEIRIGKIRTYIHTNSERNGFGGNLLINPVVGYA